MLNKMFRHAFSHASETMFRLDPTFEQMLRHVSKSKPARLIKTRIVLAYANNCAYLHLHRRLVSSLGDVTDCRTGLTAARIPPRGNP